MRLYSYFRSGTSHRLRIALNLKGLRAKYVGVDLRVEQHLGETYRSINPQMLVPALEAENQVLVQSPAIIEWLEEQYPSPALLPSAPDHRAHVRALAAIVSCDVHPVNNRRILEYLRRKFGAEEEAIQQWCATWITAGFDAYEAIMSRRGDQGKFSFGSTPTIADIHLIPQVESARRFQVDLSRWPHIQAIDRICAELEAFRLATPELQPDA
ncbi:MAG TPA: maleylacetoacetate isomerase [Ramlibacter sp.]|nr:maleylacetoacetate isomerase [Ramlibacter sp.]